jgi:hypothetical protein
MVVCPDDKLSTSEKTYYRISFTHKSGIGSNSPLLQASIFEKNTTLHSFLMTKRTI